MAYRWTIPVMPCRGFSSETFAYAAAEEWKSTARVPVVLYVGDHDPAGLDIEKVLRERLSSFYGSPVKWTRVGITWDQVEALDLMQTGTKPKWPYGYPLAFEAEALPAAYLRDLIDDEIAFYIDDDRLVALEAAEQSERGILQQIADSLDGP